MPLGPRRLCFRCSRRFLGYKSLVLLRLLRQVRGVAFLGRDPPLSIGFDFRLLCLHREHRDPHHRRDEARSDARHGRGGGLVFPGQTHDAVPEAGRHRSDRVARQIPSYVGGEFAGARITTGLVLLQALAGDDADVLSECLVDGRDRCRILLPDDRGDLGQDPLLELVGGLAGEQLIEDDAEGIDIAAHVDGEGIGVELLRAHVLVSADESADVGLHARQGYVRVGRLGDTEVDHLWLASSVDEDVAWLQIAVDHPLLVAVGDGVADFLKESEAGLIGKLEVFGILSDRLCAGDVLHHKVGLGSGAVAMRARGEDLPDARVGKLSEYVGLKLKASGHLVGFDTRLDDLHGHGASWTLLDALVDPPHASFVDHADELHTTDGLVDERIGGSSLLGRNVAPAGIQ